VCLQIYLWRFKIQTTPLCVAHVVPTVQHPLVQEEMPQMIRNWEVPHNHGRNLPCFSEMPKLVSDGSTEATLFLTPFTFHLFSSAGPSHLLPFIYSHRLDLHSNLHYFLWLIKYIGILSKSLKLSPWYKIQWFRHAWILSTHIMKRTDKLLGSICVGWHFIWLWKYASQDTQ